MKLSLFFTIVALGAMFTAEAKIKMAPIFSDNMILQRGKEVAVFGKADADSNVTVSFAGQTVSTKADAQGKWLATLKPMEASAQNRSMSVSESAGDKVEIKNVLVGEVWLCCGQSNMECPIWGDGARYRAQDGGLITQLANYKNIRFFNVATAWSVEPKDKMKLTWHSFTADDQNLRYLSACGTFFGLQLYQSLGIPIGLMDSNWGGTKIEPWTPPSGFATIPSLQKISDSLKNLKADYTPEEREENKKQKRRSNLHQQPTVLFNAMLNPFVPYTFRGAIWYQGCSNLGQPDYADKMHALYNGWAKEFKNPDLQFYFVELAPFVYGKDSQKRLGASWEQQQKFARQQSNAHMAVVNDIGDFYDIHPYNKQSVGLRLAALALKYTYGMQNLSVDSPTLSSAKLDGNKVVMNFDNVKSFYVRSQNRPDGDKVHFMEIAGADGKFVAADVAVKGNTLIAEAKSVAEPKAVRFLYADKSQCNVFNESGLPLDSFNTTLK